MPKYILIYDNWQGFKYSELGQRTKIGRFGKIILVFNYFWKNTFLNLEDFSEYVSGFKYVGFWTFLSIWKGSEQSEYSGISNMLGFCVCSRCTRFWISLNMAKLKRGRNYLKVGGLI